MSTALRGRGVVAVAANESDSLDFLGFGVTFTLPDEERPVTDFLRAWEVNGLDVGDLPEAREPVNVFQSACASVRHRTRAGRRIEITANEIRNDARGCSYQIDRKVWRPDDDAIEYERGMRAVFDKRTQDITFDSLDVFDADMALLQNSILRHWQANQRTIRGPKVRNAVRDQLIRMGGQNLRRKSGGLYFVPAQFAGVDNEPLLGVYDDDGLPIDGANGLMGVLRDMYGERGDFYTWGYANNAGVRQMVRKHFVINAAEKAEELAVKAIERVRQGKGRGVRPEMVTNLLNERRRLASAVGEFRDIVALEQGDLEANMATLDDAIAKLQELADE